ncbi:unnamed protein product [Mesocestoides corti]|uniref:PH domain-containing protein n=1 Tax=Mesocestoides corti TaxID=53468 RepID=A0A0R3U7E2_MESCO|nr:unnamed protein product [Mesocestoides corti]
MELLRLKEAMSNAPHAQQLAAQFAADAEEIGYLLHNFNTACSYVYQAQNLTVQPKNADFENVCLQFSSLLEELAGMHRAHAEELRTTLFMPPHKLPSQPGLQLHDSSGSILFSDLPATHRNVESCGREVHASLAKYMKLTRRCSPKEHDDAVIELSQHRRMFQKAAVIYHARLNAAHFEREMVPLNAFFGFLTTLRNHSKKINEVAEQTSLTDFSEVIKSQFDCRQVQSTQATEEFLNTLTNIQSLPLALFAPEPLFAKTDKSYLRSPDTSLFSKSGYLYMRVKKTFGFDWNEVYCFTQGGNLLCQQKGDGWSKIDWTVTTVSSGPGMQTGHASCESECSFCFLSLLRLDPLQPVPLLPNNLTSSVHPLGVNRRLGAGVLVNLNGKGVFAEPVDIDDRRYTFQIVSAAEKRSVILQAENSTDRDEWIQTISNVILNTSSWARTGQPPPDLKFKKERPFSPRLVESGDSSWLRFVRSCQRSVLGSNDFRDLQQCPVAPPPQGAKSVGYFYKLNHVAASICQVLGYGALVASSATSRHSSRVRCSPLSARGIVKVLHGSKRRSLHLSRRVEAHPASLCHRIRAAPMLPPCCRASSTHACVVSLDGQPRKRGHAESTQTTQGGPASVLPGHPQPFVLVPKLQFMGSPEPEDADEEGSLQQALRASLSCSDWIAQSPPYHSELIATGAQSAPSKVEFEVPVTFIGCMPLPEFLDVLFLFQSVQRSHCFSRLLQRIDDASPSLLEAMKAIAALG